MQSIPVDADGYKQRLNRHLQQAESLFLTVIVDLRSLERTLACKKDTSALRKRARALLRSCQTLNASIQKHK